MMKITPTTVLILKVIRTQQAQHRSIMSQSFIADTVGVGRTTVNRTIRELAQNGMITVKRWSFGGPLQINISAEGNKVLDQWLH